MINPMMKVSTKLLIKKEFTYSLLLLLLDLFSTLASKRQKAKNLVSITNDDFKDDLFTSNKSQFNSLSNKHKEDNNFDQVDKDLFTQKSSTSRESSLENDLFPSISPLPNDYLKDRAKVGGQRNVRAPTRKKS